MEAELWTTSGCGFCRRALAILERNGIRFQEHVMDSDLSGLLAAKRRFGHPTVPIIVLNGEFIGGCAELSLLESSGPTQ